MSSVNQKKWDDNGQNDLHYQIGNCQFDDCLLGNRFGIQIQVQQKVEKQNKTEAKYYISDCPDIEIESADFFRSLIIVFLCQITC